VDEGAGLALGELAVAMAGGAFAPMNPHPRARRCMWGGGAGRSPDQPPPPGSLEAWLGV